MPTQYIFTTHKLSRRYPPAQQVLSDISLSFLPGAKIGVLGYNGAGKSTLLRIMSGLDTPRAISIIGDDAVAFLVIAEVREAEGILHAVRGQQGRNTLQIAPPQNQRDDRLRGYGIEPCGRRIVEDQRRPVHQRPGNGNAAAHASGKFGGIFIERSF